MTLARAQAIFEGQCARGRFPGGQLVVRRGGQVVLDVAVGQGITPATRFSVFSATKPVVATVVAMLEERGLIDVTAPVARYWPAFGKPELTVLDVLTHRAAIFTPALIANPRAWGDEDAVRKALIDAVPRYPRGTLAYMPYEYGWILAEVVRAATGQRLDAFVRDQFGIPGLRFGATGEEMPSIARTHWLGTGSVKVAGVELSTTFEHDNNLPEAVMAFVPGAGLVCTAHDLAAFYDALIHGRYVKPETLAKYTTGALAFDRSNRIPLRVGRGFLLGTRTPSIYGWWGTQHCFGHAGAFCTLAFADPTRDLAVAIVTNGNRGPYESLFRFAPIGSALQ